MSRIAYCTLHRMVGIYFCMGDILWYNDNIACQEYRGRLYHPPSGVRQL